MLLFIEPVDVWLFRDGRSFNAHEDHRAESLFPPYPTVMQGIIRSHQLVVQKVDLRDQKAIVEAVGTATDYGKLRLRGPFLARREAGKLEYYFPQPADAVTVDKDEGTIRSLVPKKMPSKVRCSAPTPMLLWDDEPKKGIGGLWLREDKLRAYLRGAEVKGIPSSQLFSHENRVGIAMDHERRTTRDEALYEVQYIRPCQDVGLVVEVDGYEGWPTTGLLRMGGEGRGGRYCEWAILRGGERAKRGYASFGERQRPLSSEAHSPTYHALRVQTEAHLSCPAGAKRSPLPEELPERFKLYFATPTYFKEGWQPSDWGRFFKGMVRLQAAALRRYESIGGFDMAKGRHKSARRYVPAGSVYYFESETPAPPLAPPTLGGSNILKSTAVTDWGAEIGFGQVIIERW